MNNPEPFLQAIRENPDDDTHRLIFADWLEDEGDSGSRDRAEFIRLQMELCDATIADGKRVGLERRGHQLLARYERDWVRTDLRGLVGSGRFRRGFVEEVTLSAADFVKNAGQLLDLAPIRTVHLRSAVDHIKAISLLPGLQRLRGLGLRNNFLKDEHLRQLLESPYLNRLTWLDLANNEIRLLVPACFTSANLPNLHTLNLALNRVHGPNAGLLDNLPALRCVDFDSNYFGDEGIDAFCQVKFPRAYETLGLGSNRLTVRAVNRLARWANGSSLRTLRLDWNPLGDEGLQALARCRHFGNLRELDLSHTNAGQVGLSAIRNSPFAKQLRRLTLSGLPGSGITNQREGRRWDGVVID